MAEAVEICKLRLFLKLVSQVDAGRELESLPDIDFNIRAGNTLVGYATEAQFDAANTLASDQSRRAEIKASTADLADAFDFFRQQQTVHGGKVTADDKGLVFAGEALQCGKPSAPLPVGQRRRGRGRGLPTVSRCA